MAYEHKALRHKNDPKWVENLNKFVEKAKEGDVSDTIRNYGGDRKTTAKAAYAPQAPGEDD